MLQYQKHLQTQEKRVGKGKHWTDWIEKPCIFYPSVTVMTGILSILLYGSFFDSGVIKVSDDALATLSQIGSSLSGIGTIALACIGYKGIDQWKNQFKYERKFTLLVELQMEFLKLTDLRIAIIRGNTTTIT